MPRVILLLFCVVAVQGQVMTRNGRPVVDQQPMPTGKGVIEGTVIDSNSHEPLKKAKVNLNGPPQAPLVAVTDASGHFAFRDLPPGGFWMQASKQGYNPAPNNFGVEQNVQIMLGPDEQKKGVEIGLLPDGAVSGRVVDEEAMPVRSCQVTAVERDYQQGLPSFHRVADASTGEKGEYRMFDVHPGRYYLFARCQGQVPAPHPLLPRGDPRIPYETYLPKFYGGGADPASASRVTLASGANLENIDFQVHRVPGYNLHGTISVADPEAVDASLSINLFPLNRQVRDLWQFSAEHAPHSPTFQIRSVIPGSYLLVAIGLRPEHVFFAQERIEVGAAPPEPIEVTLNPGTEIKGSVQFDSEDHPPLEHASVWFMPVEQSSRFFIPQPRAEVKPDGTFTLTGVLPGRWRLMANAGGLTYVKSLSLGGQLVSPSAFQTSAGTTGPMRILLGTKMASVQITTSGAAQDHPVSVLMYPEDPNLFGMGWERAMETRGDQVELVGITPGRYRIMATDAPNPWPVMQRPDQLKALESHTQALDIPEGGKATATLDIMPREEFMRTLADKE